MKIDKKNLVIAAITLVAGIVLGWLFFSGPGQPETQMKETVSHDHAGEQVWTCSMHPQIRMDEPGQCPICGMDLILLEDHSDEENAGEEEVVLSESAMKLADIQTALVQPGKPEQLIYLLGIVKPDERNIAEITARFGGRIESLDVNFTGQHVRVGEKLATIYSPELISARRELQESAKFRDSNPGFYDAARTRLARWGLTEEQIDNLEKGTVDVLQFPLLSPISGTVTKRSVSPGDYVKTGSPMFEVINLNRVWVLFDAYEKDLARIANGNTINFTIQSLPGRDFSGKVKYIDPFIDGNTRVAKVRVELENPNLELKPEMFANGVLRAGTGASEELLIPGSAVLWTGKRSVVFVKVPGREKPSFIYREVVLGPKAGDQYVVVSGLQQGEEIAVNGVFRIDAAAQLAGKPSMMNPNGSKSPGTHDHHNMEMDPGQKEIGGMTSDSVSVFGNCGMCEDRIEEAAGALSGVILADWDRETKMLHLKYDPEKVTVSQVEKAVAAVGHDTENYRAPDEVYNDLPGCCLYERKPEASDEASFRVFGNCGMCEDRIEEAAGALAGVVLADWDRETKMLHLKYDPEKVTVSQVERAIAAVGHDTENYRAPDDVYNDLPGCCLFDRPE